MTHEPAENVTACSVPETFATTNGSLLSRARVRQVGDGVGSSDQPVGTATRSASAAANHDVPSG
jgi:hypothetical protein